MTEVKISDHMAWQEVNRTKILFNDLKAISIEEFTARMKAFEQYVLNCGKTDIRVYSDITDTRFNVQSIDALKKVASSTKKVVSMYAVIGVTGLKKILFNSIKPFATNDLAAFDTVEEAKQWLAKDCAHNIDSLIL